MQLKRAFSILLAAVFALSMSGCSVVGTNIETVVSPPKMSSEQADIYKALETIGQVGKTIDLKYPQSGENRSAIVLANVDDEETDEALVFYEGKNQSAMSGGGLRVCLLDQINGEWVASWNASGAGTEVDKVVFFYDNQSGRKLIVIGFSMENQQQKTYKIYAYENGTFGAIYEDGYQVLEVYDLDEDGQDEIFTVSAQSAESDNLNAAGAAGALPVKVTANLIKYQNDAFVKVDEIEMAGQAAEYNNILRDENNATFGKPALFLDEILATKSTTVTYATEVLVCEDGKLTNLMADPELFRKTYRFQAPACDDINRDGVIEIPNTRLFPGYAEGDEHPLYMTEWYRLTDRELALVSTSYINYSQGYGFLLPEAWVDQVSAKSVLENDEVEFFVFNGTLEEDGQKIMSLKVDNISDIKSVGLPAGYLQIKQMGQLVFLAKNYLIGGDYGVSDDCIRFNFVDLYQLGD